MFDTNASTAGFEPLRQLLFGAIPTLAAIFTAGQIGTPTSNSIRAFKVYNATNVPIKFSYDGINVNDIAPGTSGFTWDIATNRFDPAGKLASPRFTQFYAAYDPALSAAPTSGYVTVTIMYGRVN